MGQGALSKPVVQWWLSLNSSTSACVTTSPSGVQVPAVAQLAETQNHMTSPWRHWSARLGAVFLLCCAGSAIALLAG